MVIGACIAPFVSIVVEEPVKTPEFTKEVE